MRPPGTPAQQDRWSLRLLRDLVGRTIADWKTPAFDLLVVALVTTVTIALNLVVAVGVGSRSRWRRFCSG